MENDGKRRRKLNGANEKSKWFFGSGMGSGKNSGSGNRGVLCAVMGQMVSLMQKWFSGSILRLLFAVHSQSPRLALGLLLFNQTLESSPNS